MSLYLYTFIFIVFASCSHPHSNISSHENDSLSVLKATEYVNDLALNESLHSRGKPAFFDYKNNSEIFLAFNVKHLSSILATKEFLNAHQVQQNATFQDPLNIRAKKEDAMIRKNLGTDSLANEIRPKYAYLEIKNLPQHPLTSYNAAYGNIIAKINDSVKARATFSLGDSLEIPAQNVHSFNYTKKVKTDFPSSKIDYWEAQIWGKLSIKDVEYFLINCPGFPRLSLAAAEEILNSNIPVYFCFLNAKNQKISKTVQVKKTDLTDKNFLILADTVAPKLSSQSRSLLNSKSAPASLTFIATDNTGVQYIMLKSYDKNKNLIDWIESNSATTNITRRKKTFILSKQKSVSHVEVFARDWYGNQSQINLIYDR